MNFCLVRKVASALVVLVSTYGATIDAKKFCCANENVGKNLNDSVGIATVREKQMENMTDKSVDISLRVVSEEPLEAGSKVNSLSTGGRNPTLDDDKKAVKTSAKEKADITAADNERNGVTTSGIDDNNSVKKQLKDSAKTSYQKTANSERTANSCNKGFFKHFWSELEDWAQALTGGWRNVFNFCSAVFLIYAVKNWGFFDVVSALLLFITLKE